MSPTQGGSNVATAERIRVLVADDEETVRDVLEALLGSEPEIDLIGFAADTETAIELACKELPDVALVDVRMPGGGGPRATREISLPGAGMTVEIWVPRSASRPPRHLEGSEADISAERETAALELAAADDR
jgi:DNA-binding NarL/FixJ family response regulator